MASAGTQFGGHRTSGGSGLVQQLRAAMKRDPRRVWLLAVLVAVLVCLWGKLIVGGHGPQSASAARLDTSGTSGDDGTVQAGRREQPIKSLSDWANESDRDMGRNLFSVPYDYYPQDPNHPPPSANTDNGSAKSAATEADQVKERQILIENLREQAGGLTLEGTVLGENPRVWINGVLVGLGQPIGQTGFRVAKIESRRVFIERDGVQIELSMK
ncbi:MAG: hypothetical protein ABSH22_00335 [Tepidisphaeraceae bacterium]